MAAVVRFGADNPLSATIAVSDGTIRVTESACPQQICVRMGRKGRAGELIACVPNALVVRLEGVADPDVPDAISR